MKDYKALAEAIRWRIEGKTTVVTIGSVLAKEIVQALEEADRMNKTKTGGKT